MKFGLTEWEFQFIQDNVVAPLQERGAIVWCFGSRARGCHQKFSDLDLMVESVDNLAPLLAELRDFLEESNFPYKVDLVDINRFAPSYLSNFHAEKILWK